MNSVEIIQIGETHPRTGGRLSILDCTGTGKYAKIPMLGGVGEWLKPPDCKSGVRKGFGGSNPSPSTTFGLFWKEFSSRIIRTKLIDINKQEPADANLSAQIAQG